MKSFSFLALLTLFFLVPKAFAMPEATLANTYAAEILPYYESAGVGGEFAGKNNVVIRYRTFDVPNEKGLIVISNGKAECFLKYAETIYDLTRAGYSVYVFDHRGQGFSGRMTPDPEAGYVDSYHDYVDDLKKFYDTVVTAKPHKNYFLFAHSMGGAIATLYVAEHPKDFSALVMSAPMFEVRMSYPNFFAEALTEYFLTIGDGQQFFFDQRDYRFDMNFTDQKIDSSETRWSISHQEIVKHPEIAVGGVSFAWAYASLRAEKYLQGDDLNFPSTVPVLLLQPGQDSLIDGSAANNFCANSQINCKRIDFPSARHELLMESDATRQQVLDDTLQFYAAHTQN